LFASLQSTVPRLDPEELYFQARLNGSAVVDGSRLYYNATTTVMMN